MRLFILPISAGSSINQFAERFRLHHVTEPKMNIMDLAIGDVGVAPDGTRYRVLSDKLERKPTLGRVTVRTAIDQNGRKQKFIRGIEVERLLEGGQ